jgi:hypothetical protein
MAGLSGDSEAVDLASETSGLVKVVLTMCYMDELETFGKPGIEGSNKHH